MLANCIHALDMFTCCSIITQCALNKQGGKKHHIRSAHLKSLFWPSKTILSETDKFGFELVKLEIGCLNFGDVAEKAIM